MKITEFVQGFKTANIRNTKANPNAVSEYINKTLKIKNYIPFREKRTIAEMVVAQNTTEVNGIKKNDSINQYLSFVVAMISAHTDLEFSSDAVADYDLLAESGLLLHIIEEFKPSYDESDILLKMALASELEDNNINVLVGRFLDGILKRLDGFGETVKDKFGNINIQELFGTNFKEEDLAKLNGFLDKLK